MRQKRKVQISLIVKIRDENNTNKKVIVLQVRRGTKFEVAKFEIVFELILCNKVQSDKNCNLFILFEPFQFKNEVKR